jgi:hypothetical protein
MAGRKLPALPSLNEFPASDDIVYLVDVSDTSESPDGTSKQNEFGKIAQVDKTFAPTVTDEVGGTFTVTNFLIDKVGDIVTFSFAGRFDLAPATNSGGCMIDLPTAFQPTANWSSQTDVTCIISATNGIITAETKIIADDSGTKLLAVGIGSTTAETSVRFSAVGRYKIA